MRQGMWATTRSCKRKGRDFPITAPEEGSPVGTISALGHSDSKRIHFYCLSPYVGGNFIPSWVLLLALFIQEEIQG